MSNWQTLKLSDILPPELITAIETVDTAVSTVTGILEVVKTALGIVQQLAAGLASNPVETALKALLDEVDNQLKNLVESSVSLSVIAIPIQKQFYGPGVRAPISAVLQGITPRFGELLDEGAFVNRNRETIPLSVVNFINNASTATGGNQGFWKALMTSLQDEGDDNRPLYNSDFAVIGACLVFGSKDLTLLQPNFALFSQLMNLGERADLAAHSRPSPTSLSARVAGGSQATSRFGVVLAWPAVSPVVNRPLFSSSQFLITEIFIIRSTDPQFRTKFAWNELFTRQPTDSSTDLQEEGNTKVIARLANDGFISGYVDADSNLDGELVYYYATALRYRINNVVAPMSDFSNCVRIDPFPRAQSRRSTPPDWFSVPSIFVLIPELTDVVTQLRLVIANLRTRSVGDSGLARTIQQLLNQIKAVVDLLTSISKRIGDITSRLRALTQIKDLAAISCTLIKVESGGTNAWMAELARRLSDESDSTRPAFDELSDLVAGVVIVAGAPTLTVLEPLYALLSLFFGGSGDNPLLNAIASVEQEKGAESITTFDSRMRPTTVVTSTSAAKGFDARLQPSDKPVC